MCCSQDFYFLLNIFKLLPSSAAWLALKEGCAATQPHLLEIICLLQNISKTSWVEEGGDKSSKGWQEEDENFHYKLLVVVPPQKRHDAILGCEKRKLIVCVKLQE